MSFSPWHGLEHHRPLGELMRIRKTVYDRSQRFRSETQPVPGAGAGGSRRPWILTPQKVGIARPV